MSAVPELSVILPVFNEEGHLEELHERLRRVLVGECPGPYEIIFVDDGSTDGSFARLEALHQRDPAVRVIRFARNFGQQAALSAGLDAVRGGTVAMMDSDLQDLPEALPLLLQKLEDGYDMVRAIRIQKKHSLFKRSTSWLFRQLLNGLVVGFEVDTTVFRVARRPVIDAVNACRERDRFVLGLFGWVGFRQTAVEVPHGKRASGRSKYTLLPMLRLAASAITGFSAAPLQLVTALGGLVLSLAVMLSVALVVQSLLVGSVASWWVVLSAVLGLGGVQLLGLGVLGAYVARSHREVQERPLYVVSTELGSTASPLRLAHRASR